jgi:PilZ domain
MQRIRTISNGAQVACMRHVRMSTRYRLREIVEFSCVKDRLAPAVMMGITENVSKAGILFLTGEQIENGSRISLDICLRATDQDSGTVKLHAEGLVVRVEATGFSTNRVAAFVQFRDDPDEELVEVNMSRK